MACGAFSALIIPSHRQVMNSILINAFERETPAGISFTDTICRFITGVLLLHSWQRPTSTTLSSILYYRVLNQKCNRLLQVILVLSDNMQKDEIFFMLHKEEKPLSYGDFFLQFKFYLYIFTFDLYVTSYN